MLGAFEASLGELSKIGSVAGREEKAGKLSSVKFDNFLDAMMLR